MPNPLQRYLQAELPRRGLSIKEFAKRADISLSLAYLIIHQGEDNVRRSTLEQIATALGMSLAELASAIGHGGDLSPEEVALVAAYRTAQPAKRDIVIDLLTTLRRVTAANSQELQPANTLKGPTARCRSRAKRRASLTLTAR